MIAAIDPELLDLAQIERKLHFRPKAPLPQCAADLGWIIVKRRAEAIDENIEEERECENIASTL